MKIISLNTFGGRFLPALLDFVRTHAPTTEVFCFQEVLSCADAFESNGSRSNLYEELTQALPDHNGYFAPIQGHFDMQTQVPQDVTAGLAIFVSKSVLLEKTGDFLIFGKYNGFVPNDYSTLAHNLQYVKIHVNNQQLTIANVHGTSQPGNKLDTPARLKQSQKILDFFATQPGPNIVVGDFNLLPHTKSVQMFSNAGFINLITAYGITTTRGTLMHQIWPEYGLTPQGWQEFADYTFVTPDISVTNFSVPDLPLSDHLPMILEFKV